MIDMEVKKLLSESYIRVKNLLKTNESHLKSLATALIKEETMSSA